MKYLKVLSIVTISVLIISIGLFFLLDKNNNSTTNNEKATTDKDNNENTESEGVYRDNADTNNDLEGYIGIKKEPMTICDLENKEFSEIVNTIEGKKLIIFGKLIKKEDKFFLTRNTCEIEVNAWLPFSVSLPSPDNPNADDIERDSMSSLMDKFLYVELQPKQNSFEVVSYKVSTSASEPSEDPEERDPNTGPTPKITDSNNSSSLIVPIYVCELQHIDKIEKEINLDEGQVIATPGYLIKRENKFFLINEDCEIQINPLAPYSATLPPSQSNSEQISLNMHIDNQVGFYLEPNQNNENVFDLLYIKYSMATEEDKLLEDNDIFQMCQSYSRPSQEIENALKDTCLLSLAKGERDMEICYYINELDKKIECYSYFDDCNTLDPVIRYDCNKTIEQKPTENSENWEMGTIIDERDKQEYPWVKIHDQTWFAKNLNYNNGCLDNNWQDRSETGWCGYHQNDAEKYSDWGLLYQYSAITEEDVCPDGWHVPSDQDFKDLELNLGLPEDELDEISWRNNGEVGKKLKSTQWNGTNEYGFSLFPRGFRYSGGSFHDKSYGAFINLLTSTLIEGDNINTDDQGSGEANYWIRIIGYDEGINRNARTFGSASYIRCIKND